VIAASLCWVIGKGNHRFGQRVGELRVKDLMSHLSLSQSSVSERGYQIMHAAGIQPTGAYEVRLGSPDLLVSTRRRQIIELRDRHRAAISAERRA
jgi:predicted transcriptional regulator